MSRSEGNQPSGSERQGAREIESSRHTGYYFVGTVVPARFRRTTKKAPNVKTICWDRRSTQRVLTLNQRITRNRIGKRRLMRNRQLGFNIPPARLIRNDCSIGVLARGVISSSVIIQASWATVVVEAIELFGADEPVLAHSVFDPICK